MPKKKNLWDPQGKVVEVHTKKNVPEQITSNKNPDSLQFFV